MIDDRCIPATDPWHELSKCVENECATAELESAPRISETVKDCIDASISSGTIRAVNAIVREHNAHDPLQHKFVPTFYSSFLFLIPLVFAWHRDVIDLAVGSFICLLTSCVNHGIPNHPIIRPIDIITVNSVALYFTIIGWFRLHPYYFAAVVIFGSVSLLFYLFVAKHYHWNYHVVVHVVAVTGVCIYIHGIAARREEFGDGLMPPVFDA
jgi:hypothetical protein